MARPSSDRSDPDPGSLLRRIGRAALLRCPNCGGRPLFRRWVIMRKSCPDCHLLLDRGEGDYFLGGYVLNFVAAEMLVVLGGLAAIVATWPEVPWDGIRWGLLLLVAPAPVLFFPFSRTLWLALDLSFRPVTLADLEGHGENVEKAETSVQER